MYESRNLTADSFEQPSKKRKRNRETLSCQQCRDRKVACDRAHPCASCIRHKRADECKYAADDHPAASTLPHQDQGSSRTSPQARRVYSSDAHTADRQSYPVTDHPPTPAASRDTPVSYNSSSNHTGQDHDAHTSHSIFASGRLATKPTGASYYIGPTAWTIPAPTSAFYESNPVWTSLIPQWQRLNRLRRRFHSSHHSTILSITSTVPPTSDLSPLQMLVPADDECRALIDSYLRTLHPLFPVIDEVRFLSELESYLTDRSSATQSWLAMLVIILALGYALPVAALNIPPHTISTKYQIDMVAVAQRYALDAALQTHRPPLLSLQNFLLLILAKRLEFDWVDGNDGTSGLLGLAQRLVFTMGLHREPNLAQHKYDPAEADLRRKIFTTYLDLEFQHSLDTAMPFTLRMSDHDVELSSDHHIIQSDHQTQFMKALPVLARTLQMTNSHKAGPSENFVRDVFLDLRTISSNDASRQMDPGLYDSPAQAFSASLTPMYSNRLQVGLTLSILNHAPRKYRDAILTDVLRPSLAVLDQFDSLRTIIERTANPEAKNAWMKLLILFFKQSVFNTIAYFLVVLRDSLVDQTLMAIRTPATLYLDSSHIFRRCRTALTACHCSFSYSFQALKDVAGFSSYLVVVEHHYRTYIETGEVTCELLRDKDSVAAGAMAKALDDIFGRAEAMFDSRDAAGLTPFSGGTEGSSGTLVSTPATDGADALLGQIMDPFIMDHFDWPWSDMLPGDQRGIGQA